MPSVFRLLQLLVAQPRLMRRLGFAMGPWNPWLPEQRADPYPVYARLRERHPVLRSRLLGAWIVSRYVDVERVLRAPEFSSERGDAALFRLLRWSARDEPEFLNFLEHDLLMIDGARHAHLRGLVAKAFTPRRIEALRPRVEALADELVDRALARRGGRIEVISDLAMPLPAAVIGEMLGVPAGDRDRLLGWSHQLVEFLDPLSGREGLEPPKLATRAFAEYFRELLAERRRAPRDDLLTALVDAEVGGERLGEAEILALAMLILVAGHETTTNLIGSAVWCLIRAPAERARLQAEPALLPGAVEEFLRFESPVQLTDRIATESCEIAGVSIRRGQLVGVLLGSANRDPQRFADPDRLDLGREENRHLAFGLGRHFCLGAQLARLETQVALAALLRRCPDFRGPATPPRWKASAVLRGPIALELHAAREG